MPVPIVLVAEELSPAAVALLESDFEVRYVDGADRAELLPALAGVRTRGSAMRYRPSTTRLEMT